MEEEQGPRGFRIDFSEQEPAAPEKQPGPADAEPAKKSGAGRSRLFKGAIWLVVLTAAAGGVFAAYYHLHVRLSSLESMSRNEIRGLSGKIDERLTAISELVRARTDQVRGRVLETEKTAQNNAGAITELEKSVENLQNSLSDMENRLETQIESLNQKAESAEADLARRDEKIQELEKSAQQAGQLKDEITRASQAAQQAVSQTEELQRQIDTIAGQQPDPEEIEKSIDQRTGQIRKSLEKEVENKTSGLESRINSLDDQIQGLEAMINALEDTREKDNGQDSSGTGQSSDESGKIIEQEL
ncbi:MAG: hypothetical protein ACOC0W_07680 [Desulfosalsimonas sp.]